MSFIIVIVWASLALLYLIYDFILYYSVLSIKQLDSNTQQQPLSVIIAAKNEAENLSRYLPKILNQDYPNYEVIVVNDQSSDDSSNILIELSQAYQHLKVINVDSNIKSYKKEAVNLGIEHSAHKYLVFTDADCYPASENWLKHVQNHFTNQHQIVLGYSPYEQKIGVLNTMIRFETTQTAINYFGFANIGIPYMGVGRNMAYTKSVFESLNGFKSHEHILSGDDDLLVNQASTSYKFNLCLDPKSFVISQPKTDFQSWIAQKRRHISTAPQYALKHKVMLAGLFLSKFLFWVLVIPLSLYFDVVEFQVPILSSFILTLMGLKSLINSKVLKRLHTKDLWVKFYLCEFGLICIQCYIFTLNLFTSKNTW